MIGGRKATKMAPIASPFDREKLPPWTITHADGKLRVHDGIVAFVCEDSLTALRWLGNLSRIWPDGTAKPASFEIRRAKHAGFQRGLHLGIAMGTLLGVVLSNIVMLAARAWWGP